MRARVERRLTAILAADVVGYSLLIGADEEGTLSRFKATRVDLFDRKIAEHRGRIVHTSGDGLLVEFSSVVDALRGATEVQAGSSERNAEVPSDLQIQWRIGINVGDVVVEDGDIFGEASTSRPGSRLLPRPVASASRPVCRKTPLGRWISPSKIWATSSCTTSAGR